MKCCFPMTEEDRDCSAAMLVITDFDISTVEDDDDTTSNPFAVMGTDDDTSAAGAAAAAVYLLLCQAFSLSLLCFYKLPYVYRGV